MHEQLKKFFTPVKMEYEYLTLDSNGLIVDLSSQGVVKFADSPDNFKLGQDVYRYFPELIGLEEIFINISLGHLSHFELKGVNRSSETSPFYFNIYIFPVEDFMKLAGKIFVGFEDTTQLMLQEKKYNQIAREYELTINALEKNNAYVNAVFNSINDLLLMTNHKGIIQSCNDTALKILDYKNQELINNYIEIIFSDNQTLSSFNLDLFLSGQQLSDSIEVNCKTKTGREISVLFSCSKLSWDKHESPEFLWIGRDITERKKVELKLHQQLEQDRLLSCMTQRIRQSLSLEEIIKTTVTEVRQLLQTDCVLCCQLSPELEGTVLAQSFAQTWSKNYNSLIKTVLIPQKYLKLLKHGETVSLELNELAAIYNNFCEKSRLIQLKSKLMVPIMIHPSNCKSSNSMNLWGVLSARQYKKPRAWQDWEIHLLEKLANQVAVAIQQAELYEKLQRVNQELEELAITDGLTEIANHRFFDQTLKTEWHRLRREVAPLSLILCDIDYFKRYNDTYGHLAGDSCLQQVAKALRDSVKRPSDLVARYGGEEFAIILLNTNLEGATHIAEIICTQIRSLKIPHRDSLIKPYVTLSVGVASTIPMPSLTPETLIMTADYALYQAKKNGRDRIFTITDPLDSFRHADP